MDTRLPSGIAPETPPTTATTSEYEFNDGQSKVFSNLGSAMGFVAIAMIAFGTISIFVGVAQLFGGAGGLGGAALMQGVVLLLTGIWTRGAAGSVRQIVASQGNDVANLMHAMEHLGKVYRLQRALLVVAIALVILGILASGTGALRGH